jgi:hypothetical protein
MKKTLLIAAAALAAGIISTQAQVYSQNVVGYINLPVPNGHYALLANQLDTGSNTLDNVLTSGTVSSDTTILLWNGTSFHQYIYYNSGDSPDGNNGWYDPLNNNPATNVNLSLSSGAFIHNSSGAQITLPTVGQVFQGTNTVTVSPGYNIYSVPEPLAGISIDQLGFPAVSSADTYLKWTGTSYYQLIYYNSGDSPDGGTGWYDPLTNVAEDTNSADWHQAGQAFFVHHVGAAETWTNSFTVQ